LKDKISKLDPEIKENSHHNEEGLSRRLIAYKEKLPNGLKEF